MYEDASDSGLSSASSKVSFTNTVQLTFAANRGYWNRRHSATTAGSATVGDTAEKYATGRSSSLSTVSSLGQRWAHVVERNPWDLREKAMEAATEVVEENLDQRRRGGVVFLALLCCGACSGRRWWSKRTRADRVAPSSRGTPNATFATGP